MSNNKSSNKTEVPEAKAAMDRFKTEVASELGVNLKEGYNGDLTSREAGSIGGEMVRQNDQETGRADEINQPFPGKILSIRISEKPGQTPRLFL